MNKLHNYNFIAIEGNIGAGKTSLAKLLSSSFNAHLVLEQFEENVFLPKFYENPVKYALPLELSFLAERHQQILKEVKNGKYNSTIVSDYFFLKSMIFASGNLNEDEMIIYSKLFNILNDSLPKPDLFVYLNQSPENLLQNIKKRGRAYEQNIGVDYLSKIERNYFTFFEQTQHLKIVIIDVNNVDFIDNSAIYQQFIAIINQQYNHGVSHRTIEINR